jgi:hypothetical protein
MRRARLCWVFVAALALVAGAGCGSGNYPVTGRVVYDDGTPVTEGTVVGESDTAAGKVMVQGELSSDGSFELGTTKPKNGAPAGKYRVMVIVRALGDSEEAEGKQIAVDPKFSSYETSKLEFEVTSGPNEWKITVTKPKPKKK